MKLGPKIPHLGIFGLQLNKNYYQIFDQHPRICETINFHSKQQQKKTWDQKVLFGLFQIWDQKY